MEPFDVHNSANRSLYLRFKKHHPQWWVEVNTKDLIGVKINSDNLSDHFPTPGLEPYEWNELWIILVTRMVIEVY